MANYGINGMIRMLDNEVKFECINDCDDFQYTDVLKYISNDGSLLFEETLI